MQKLDIKNIDKLSFLLFSGMLFCVSQFIISLYTFLVAYFCKAKATLVTINDYGEADLELFLMFIMLDFFIICLIYEYKRCFKKKV